MPELDGPPAPRALAYLWGWFIELSAARGRNGFGGLNALSYQELDAWARLSGIAPTPFEVGVLRRLDQAFLTVHADHGRHRRSHGNQDNGA